MYKNIPYYIFNNLYSNKLYRTFFWLFVVVMCFFTVNKYVQFNMLESIGLIITDYNFLGICFFAFSFLITKKIYDEYNNNEFLKIRFCNQKKFVSEEIKANIFCQTIFFVLVVIIIIILLNFISSHDYSVVFIDKFKMNSLVFCIYSLLKIYLFTIMFSTINIYIMNFFKINYIYIINVLLCFSILLNAYLNTKVIKTIITPFIGNSLITANPYENYYCDITNYLFHFIILICIFCFVKKVKKV